MTPSQFTPREYITLVGAIFLTCALITKANAACGEADQVRCYSDLISLNVVAARPDGFISAGQMKRGTSIGVALLRINSNGTPRPLINLPWPGISDVKDQTAYQAPPQTQIAVPTKIIVVPNGDAILIGQLQDSATSTTAGWAMRISKAGDILWNNWLQYSDGKFSWTGSHDDTSNESNIVFHSAIYDSTHDQIIIVGRLTNGADNGRCDFWSQGLVLVLDANGNLVSKSPITQGEQTKSPTNRQALFDIAPGDIPNSFIVAGFGTVPNSTSSTKCQDNVLIDRLSFANDTYTLAPIKKFGAKDTNEGAFAIREATRGTYLLAGYHRDSPSPNDIAAAQAYLVKLTPFSISPLTVPILLDNSDKKAGAKFRAVLPLSDKSRFLLVGSASFKSDPSNRGLWQIVSGDLQRNEQPIVFSKPSDIYDVATSYEGRTLAVGWISDDAGQKVGWSGFIGQKPVTLEQRPPNKGLPDVATLPPQNGIYQIPTASMNSGGGFFGKNLDSGSQIDFGFSVPTARTFKLNALTESGDIDILVSDQDKHPVAFSNFKNNVPEMLIATLPQGNYVVSLIAQTPVASFEFRIAPSQEIPSKALIDVGQLSEDQRTRLANDLAKAGYTAPIEPSIALGGETLRGLLSAQEGSPSPIGPGGIGVTIDRDLTTH